MESELSTKELVRRLEKIEEELKEGTRSRHNYNSHIASVVDAEREERMRMEDSIDEALADLSKKIDALMHSVNGVLGTSGINDQIKDFKSVCASTCANNELRFKELQEEFRIVRDWRLNQRNFIVLMSTVCTFIGNLIGFFVGYWLG
jgi:hypothetical protein